MLKHIPLLCILCLLNTTSFASEKPSAAELEEWFNDESESKIDQVNEGQIHFIKAPNKKVLHSDNRLQITQQSIDDGWVKLHQCYRHLDAVPEVEVVYQYHSMRDLKIEKTSGIGKAQVENNTVQLKDVSKQASLCVSAEVRAFYQNDDKTFTLVSGPYQRRFLDGYYPMHVTLEIHYPDDVLRFLSARPDSPAGFRIERSKNRLHIRNKNTAR